MELEEGYEDGVNLRSELSGWGYDDGGDMVSFGRVAEA
jgi:hypothetical protein